MARFGDWVYEVSSVQGNGRAGETIRFGVFEVDPRTGELRKAGSRIRLQDQPFKVLVALLERPGEAVTRQELQQRIWPTESFGDFDHAVNVAIAKLRTALGDSAENPRYIETLPRRGYRFVFPTTPPAAPERGIAEKSERAQSPPSVRLIAALTPLFVVVLVALAFFYWSWRTRQIKPMNFGSWNQTQLTHNTSDNLVCGSAISPDGKYLAFVDQLGLHLIVLDTDETTDVPLPPEIRTRLETVSWFPDGQRLVLQTTLDNEGHDVLWLSSIFGGTPQELRAGSFGAAVSADSAIAFITAEGREIWVTGPHGENPRKLLGAAAADTFCSVAWSPLSTRLAYASDDGTISTVSLDAESTSAVFSSRLFACAHSRPLVWLRDGHLIFEQDSSSPPPLYSEDLWDVRMDPKTGRLLSKPEKLTNWTGFLLTYLSASRDGSRLAVSRGRNWSDVYLAELRSGATQIRPPQRLSAGENFDSPDAWFPDSKSLLFTSDRNRRPQIFRQQLDQNSPELLIPGSINWDASFAQFSPDGAWILYGAFSEVAFAPFGHLVKVPVSGGAAETLFDVANSVMVNWICPRNPTASCVLSRPEHGQLVFYAFDVDHGLGKELARTKMQDAGAPQMDITSDGRRVAISNPNQLPEKIRIVDLVNKTERELSIPRGAAVNSVAWAADGKSLFASIWEARSDKIVEFQPDGSMRTLWDAGNYDIESLVPSPDGRYLAFSRGEGERNVWLLDNSPERPAN